MKTWKKLLISCSCFLTFFFGEILVNIACGPERDPYDYYISYFHQNVANDQLPSNFFVSNLAHLFGVDSVDKEGNINAREWSAYLKGKVSPAAVYQIMYSTDSLTNTKLIGYNGKNINDLPDSLCKNDFVVHLASPEAMAALNYFRFAKSCEPYVSAAANYWDPLPRDSTKMVKKAAEAMKMVAANKGDNFLRLRYAFQGLRLFSYAGDAKTAVKTYEQYIKGDQQTSAVMGWSMSLYAGALRAVGEYDKAAFLFARVFRTNPERRIQAYRNFNFIEPDIESTLKFANEKQDKANIYAISAFGKSGFDMYSLKGVYSSDPSSTLNGFLLTREINKLENVLIDDKDIAQTDYFFYNDPDTSRDSMKRVAAVHLVKLRKFALQLDAGKKYPQYGFGAISAAYLSWMQHRDDLAVKYLSNINASRLRGKVADQYRIVRLLLNVRQLRKGSKVNEIELLASLKWLDEKRYLETDHLTAESSYYELGNYTNRHFNVTAHSFYQQELAPAYLKMGDTARAALALLKGDLNLRDQKVKRGLFEAMGIQTNTMWQEHLGPKALKTIVNYSMRPATGTLTGFLAAGVNTLNKDDLYELYGTACLRVNDYKNAVNAFNKVSMAHQYFAQADYVWLDTTYTKSERKVLYSNPFEERINDYPKQYAYKPNGLNKMTFAKEMLRLSTLAQTDPKNAALYYYKMANGIYQTGKFGNAWSFLRYSWSAVNTPPQLGEANYLHAATAKKFYLKARALTSDKELKAKITFMLAKCAQKEIYYKQNKDNYDGRYFFNAFTSESYFRLNLKNPYFNELKNSYSQTAFYKQAAHECSYFDEFIHPAPVKKKGEK